MKKSNIVLLLTQLIGLFVVVTGITNNPGTVHKGFFTRRNSTGPNDEKLEDQCSSRLDSAINGLSTRRSGGSASFSPLDLTGYALHQSLRSAPFDMYLTDMRVRAPPKWARVDKCRFDPAMGTLQARLAFGDLSVVGKVSLYNEKLALASSPLEKCDMKIRMRRAGVGFTVQADEGRNNGLSTAATFIEPQFVSVHSFGCDSEQVRQLKRSGHTDVPDKSDELLSGKAEVTQEMEEVFLRGVRSLLTRYLEHRMEPALRDTLMMSLGYSLSYG